MTSFSGMEDRAKQYIDTVGELTVFRTRLHRQIEETRNHPDPSLAERWRIPLQGFVGVFLRKTP
ncbi:MAG: hypothetical protein ACE5HN_08010 [Nitrospiria bacterium]